MSDSDRRNFLRTMGIGAADLAGGGSLAACSTPSQQPNTPESTTQVDDETAQTSDDGEFIYRTFMRRNDFLLYLPAGLWFNLRLVILI